MKGYKYETHLHTCEGSKCGRNTGYEMAIAAKEAGYTGIIVTDHNWGGNTAVDRELAWEDFVHLYTRGYEGALKAGKKIDLDVFWGWEAGYQGTEFLIYGLSIEWMLSHPEIREVSIEEQFALVHAGGGLVIHAHPYREEPYIPQIRLFPEYIDGVEVINAMHSNPRSKAHFDPQYNELALAYARKYNKLMTAGSDIHVSDFLGGGMIFPRRLTSAQDFVKALKNEEALYLTDGHEERSYQALKQA